MYPCDARFVLGEANHESSSIDAMSKEGFASRVQEVISQVEDLQVEGLRRQ